MKIKFKSIISIYMKGPDFIQGRENIRNKKTKGCLEFELI